MPLISKKNMDFGKLIFAIFGVFVLIAAIVRSRKASTPPIDEIKKVVSLSVVLALGVAWCLTSGDPMIPGLALGSVFATFAGAATNSVTFTHVPQFITFSIATVPTSFQINVNGDGLIFNLDGAGLNSMTHIKAYARVANTWLFQLADGLVNKKNGTITVANADAAALTVREWSPNKIGSFYCTYNSAALLAASAFELNKFAYASFPSAGATDIFNIAYDDGSVDNVLRDEINANLTWSQNLVASQFNIDNMNARISQVTITPVLAQNFYVMKYQDITARINAQAS